MNDPDAGIGSLDDFDDVSGQSDDTSEDKMIQEGRAAAILSYLPFGCFLALVNMRDNKFAMRHAAQGLVLTIVEIVALLFLIPKVSEFFWIMVILACVGMAVVGVIGVAQSRVIKLPLVAELAKKLNLSD